MTRWHRPDRERGFSLVEVMVVVLVISVLAAVAIPTFLGAQNHTRDRTTHDELRAALTAAKRLASDRDGAFRIDGVDLAPEDLGADTSISFGAIGDASQTVVGLSVERAGNAIVLAMQSPSGAWFGIAARSNGSVEHCTGTAPTDCDRVDDRGFVRDAW